MKFPIEKKFKLTDNFMSKYKEVRPKFGFDGLGEFVFIRTYSRIKEDGTNEQWWETVRRVVEGIYSIQWEHIDYYNLGWNGNKAQRSAQEMYDRIFNFKMLGSGRALWSMGTPIVMEKGLTEALFNCSFISTEDTSNIGRTFANMMDFLMLGVGVGLDVRGAGKIVVREPFEKEHIYVIPDTREGWVESLELVVNSYFGGKNYIFDYSKIRDAGEPIKTFGGTASGYKPLKHLHEEVHKVLSLIVGKEITETAIADIANNIGVCVVSGNVRRSAEILLGEATEEFLGLKNYVKNPERQSFGWASNNTVISSIGDDYSDAAERIKTTSEPGFLWLENFHKYGRMRDDEADGRDYRVAGVNPCFGFNEKILTKEGYKTIGNLSGKTIEIVDKNGKVQKGKIFKSGEKPTVEIRLSDKRKIICTKDHEFMNVDGDSIIAETSKGQQLLPYLSEPKNIDETYVLYGFIQGDGNLGRLTSDEHLGLEINVGKDDQDVYSLIENIPHKKHSDGRSVYLQGKIKKELNKLGFSSERLPERAFPSKYDEWDTSKKVSFIRGCFSANGCVNNRGRITYKSTSRKFVDAMVKTLKNDFGIFSYITTNKSKENAFSNGIYRMKESYDINISKHESKQTFFNNISFHHGYKRELLKSFLLEQAPFVTSVRPTGKVEAVYDFSLPEVHWGVINGFVAHNCGEIGLESQEMCNLVEVIPSNHENLDDFKKTIKYAYLFAKTITLLKTNWEETNRVLLRNRRIGLSMTGVAQFREKFGLSELGLWQDDGYKLIQQYDEIYSDWFAVPKSIKTTTIKPSGTLSLLAGVTAGVHYPQANYYVRRVRLAKNSNLINPLKTAGYNIEPAFEDKEGTVVVEFPVSLKEEIRTIDDISMWEQIKLAEFCQRNWADNSVSVTVTFSKDEEKDLLPAIEYAQFGLKSVSFLPKLDGGAYKQMPYETIDKETYLKMSKKIKPIDFSNISGAEGVGERYCETDVCEIKTEEKNIVLTKEFNLGK